MLSPEDLEAADAAFDAFGLIQEDWDRVFPGFGVVQFPELELDESDDTHFSSKFSIIVLIDMIGF